MKNFLKIIVYLIFAAQAFPQSADSTFSDLRGMEDYDGNTHLFYRFYTRSGNDTSYSTNNSIYQYDIVNNKDNLFLLCSSYDWIIMSGSIDVEDFNFWNNDPAKYIYTGVQCGMDCAGYVKRFDSDYIGLEMFFFAQESKIEISKQNDSLIYSSANHYILKSTDGGWNWAVIDSLSYLTFRTLFPYNDQILFADNGQGILLKSTDGGKTFKLADTSKIEYHNNVNFFYDKDSAHIYRVQSFHYTGAKSNLFVSGSSGDSSSWYEKYSSGNSIFASIDYSKSGVIYLADGKNLLVSDNFGTSFQNFKTLDSDIVGIYKKPNSEILYAATQRDLLEITKESVKSIKHVVVGVNKGKNNSPGKFILSQNYPNPFNPSTTISYTIPEREFVTIKVYDILGRLVSTLVNEEKSAGTYNVEFTTNHLQPTTNDRLSSGIYFYQLKAGDNFRIKKMILLK